MSEARSLVFASRIESAKVRIWDTPTLPSGAALEVLDSELAPASAAVMSRPLFWIVKG